MLKATYCALALLIGATIGGFAPKDWRGKEPSAPRTVAFAPGHHTTVH
jgi:hypothetical protein